MLPTKIGQIVRFHTPLSDEDPNQQYVVLQIISDDERPRAQIQPLGTNLSFPPVNTVKLSDLETVVVETNDLIGETVIVNKSDYSQVKGRVINVSEQKIDLNLSKGIKGVETNVWLTVTDQNGKEHFGTLFVN